LHRAISWLQAAEDYSKSPDIQLITLWIAYNSLYAADEVKHETLNERDLFVAFILKLLCLDEGSRIYHLLWNKFSGSIRLLIENKFVYAPFWEHQRGNIKGWEQNFKKSIEDANKALANQNVDYLLRIILDRLYVLRNQIIHGGATYKSKVNRAQIKDGCNILSSLLPIFIDIMLQHPGEDWGNIYYPPVEG
jgi:hypothetical protein